MRKENASEDWKCIMSMFLTSCSICLMCLVMHAEAEQGGRNSPGAESLLGLRKVLTMSQVLFSIQYICFRNTSGSNMGAPNLFLAPGAI